MTADELNPERSALELALALLAAIDHHELDSVPNLYTDDARIEDPGGVVFTGAADLPGHLATFTTAFPDIRHQIADTFDGGGTAIVQGHITGTHTGVLVLPGHQVPATGRPIKLRFALIIRTTHGRIARDELYLDRADLSQQLIQTG